MLHAKIFAERDERLLRFGIFKAKASSLVGVVNRPINFPAPGDARGLRAQIVQLPAGGSNDQAMGVSHPRASLQEGLTVQ